MKSVLGRFLIENYVLTQIYSCGSRNKCHWIFDLIAFVLSLMRIFFVLVYRIESYCYFHTSHEGNAKGAQFTIISLCVILIVGFAILMGIELLMCGKYCFSVTNVW